MTITEPFAVILGLALIVKVVMDNRQIRKMDGEIRALRGVLYRKDGVLDTLSLQKPDKPDLQLDG